MRQLLWPLIAAALLTFGCADDHDDSNPEPSHQPDWPADYPITGDSVAVISVSQEGAGDFGTIFLELYPDSAPNHVRNFKWLSNVGFYDSLTFHRVIAGFVIQGGDPNGDGTGGPGWTVDTEFNGILHEPGILSMARAQDPNSAGSQFFICLGVEPHLDYQYTAFGRVISGMDVVDRISHVPVSGSTHSSPVNKVYMTSIRIISRPDSL